MFQNFYTVGLATAKSFITGVKASRVIQDITYTAASAYAEFGNAVTIAYTAGAVAGAEVVTVVGYAITIQIATGVSTATQVKAKFDAKAEAVALATAAITGTAGTAQIAAVAIALTGGTGDIDIVNNLVKITAHGWGTGRKVALTNPGTIPPGLAATNYWVIVLDDDHIQLAATLADAIAETPVPVDITGIGVGTTTLTPAALAAASVKLQESNTDIEADFVDIASMTTAITVTGKSIFKPDTSAAYIRLVFTITDGQIEFVSKLCAKGDN